MFWWFERGGHYLRCEAQQTTAGRFELRIIGPDGAEQVEHFTDSRDLGKRQRRDDGSRKKAGQARTDGFSERQPFVTPKPLTTASTLCVKRRPNTPSVERSLPAATSSLLL